jgi:hypothetical protein
MPTLQGWQLNYDSEQEYAAHGPPELCLWTAGAFKNIELVLPNQNEA